MTDQDSLDAIADLLMRLSGISSTAAFLNDDGSVSIYFRCRDFESLKLISSCAVGANVLACVADPESRLCFEEHDAFDCPFVVRIDDDDCQNGPPTTTQVFGVHLARKLKALGRVDSELSNRLQAGWNAVPL